VMSMLVGNREEGPKTMIEEVQVKKLTDSWYSSKDSELNQELEAQDNLKVL
jgi:hypothetical protein